MTELNLGKPMKDPTYHKVSLKTKGPISGEVLPPDPFDSLGKRELRNMVREAQAKLAEKDDRIKFLEKRLRTINDIAPGEASRAYAEEFRRELDRQANGRGPKPVYQDLTREFNAVARDAWKVSSPRKWDVSTMVIREFCKANGLEIWNIWKGK